MNGDLVDAIIFQGAIPIKACHDKEFGIMPCALKFGGYTQRAERSNGEKSEGMVWP